MVKYHYFILLLCLLSYFLCTLPEDPYDPSKTSISLLISTSRWNSSSIFLDDTVGKDVYIEIPVFLPENIDSVELKINEESGLAVFDTVFKSFKQGIYDTLTKKIIFNKPGKKIVTVTPYSSIAITPLTATIFMKPKDSSPNHKPSIIIPSTKIILPSQVCSLSIQLADIDSGQKLSVQVVGDFSDGLIIGDSLFIWSAPEDFIGKATFHFIVIDNGIPPMSDTSTTIITVTNTPHPPAIQIKGNRFLRPLEICSLFINVSDEDEKQNLSISMSGNPQGSKLIDDSIFIWPVPNGYSGNVNITFTVTDNGTPPLSTTALVILTVSGKPINHAPKWTVDTIPMLINDTGSILLSLSNLCNDADGDLLTYILLYSGVNGDTIVEGVYSFKNPKAAGNSYIATIVAEDPYEEKDTLFILINVKTSLIDTTPPLLTFCNPYKDSTIVKTPSMVVSIRANDESGIDSVICNFGNTTPVVTATDSIFSATITGLKVNTFNTIRFIATDASANGNRETLYVTVYYDSTLNDLIPPVFILVSGPASGTTLTSASVSYTYRIIDDNGVDSVYWVLNGTRIADLAAKGLNNNEYAFTATLRSPPHNNTIVIYAKDRSSNHNRGSETITLNYNQPPAAISQLDLKTPRATALTVTLSGTDPDNDPLSGWAIISTPLHGTITTTTLPTFTYTPSGNYEGKDSLMFTVSDGISTSNPGKVVITVTANNIAPKIVNNPVSTSVNKGQTATFSVTINNDVYPQPDYIRWVHNNTDTIPGTNSLTCTIRANLYSDSGYYKVVVHSPAFPATPAVSENAKLTVNDVTKPQITLNGGSTVTLNKSSTWNDPGATATDDKDGPIIPVITGSVNTSLPGNYTLTYTATDKAGNSSSVTRTVVVVPAWERFGPTAAAADITSYFVLGANETPYIVQEEKENDDYNLVLRKLNTSGNLVWVSSLYDKQSYNELSLAVGSDGSTLFVGTTQGIYSYSPPNWSNVDETTWNSVGGYGLHIGSSNTPYIAAMDMTLQMRIWKLDNGTWTMVGSNVEIPLGYAGSVGGGNCFYITNGGQNIYTIGNDHSDRGVSVATLNGVLWNIEKINNDGGDYKIVAAGSTLYASFSEGNDYIIYEKKSGIWNITKMSNTGVAANSFDMAVSPSGVLYAARLEESNVIIKKRVDSSWQNVPLTGSDTPFTVTNGSKIQILPGTVWCYVVVKTKTPEWIFWRIQL